MESREAKKSQKKNRSFKISEKSIIQQNTPGDREKSFSIERHKRNISSNNFRNPKNNLYSRTAEVEENTKNIKELFLKKIGKIGNQAPNKNTGSKTHKGDIQYLAGRGVRSNFRGVRNNHKRGFSSNNLAPVTADFQLNKKVNTRSMLRTKP